eukprot:XP_014055172.1 PREDICTED: PDZ domain-containing protein 11 isoform X1 [Salmo salar]
MIIAYVFFEPIGFETMDQKIPYDDYQLPVVFLPSYESPPAWIAPQERIHHPDYNNELTQFLPRTIVLKKPPGAQLGFNIRGGKASQLGIFISKVVPDSDAHRAGLQEGDQVLSVNEVDFQDIEHSRNYTPSMESAGAGTPVRGVEERIQEHSAMLQHLGAMMDRVVQTMDRWERQEVSPVP